MDTKVIDSGRFLRDLAARTVEEEKEESIVVRAEKQHISQQDEAVEHAKAYWMMGYTWHEIEAVLEDFGFNDKIIDNALELAKRYARDMVEDGPFKAIREGQLVKLNDGSFGTALCVSPEFISIKAGDEVIQVRDRDIDQEASSKLKQAFLLRLAADKLYKIAQEEEYKIPKRPERYVTKPKPQEEFKTTIKPSPGAPPGWGTTTPHVTEVAEVDNIIAGMLNEIDIAEEELRSVKEELGIANELAQGIREKRKGLERKQREFAQRIFTILGSQNESVRELEGEFFMKYKNKLVGLKRQITPIAEEPGVVEELDALKEILASNHPRIFKKVMDALDEYKRVNSSIIERVEEAFAYYPPARKKQAQIWERIVDWASGAWDRISGIAEDLYEFVFPTIDESVSAIDEFTTSFGKLKTAKSAELAVRNLIN